jgi:hypothetical protein
MFGSPFVYMGYGILENPCFNYTGSTKLEQVLRFNTLMRLSMKKMMFMIIFDSFRWYLIRYKIEKGEVNRTKERQ